MPARLFLVLLSLVVIIGLPLSALAAESTAPEGAAAAGQAPDPQKPRVRVTISKQTTVIIEPLRPDGYPDYLEAVNRMASQGVTPQNNAMVLLVKAFGPGHIDQRVRAEYFKRLGIDPLPEQGEYFVQYYDYVKRTAADALRAPSIEEGQEPKPAEADRQLELATNRPWSKADCPLVAGWLEANQKPLRLIVEASGRPRMYVPIVPEEPQQLIMVPLSSLQTLREANRALVARANLRLAEGRTQQAMEDLVACHGLARLVGQGPTLVEGLVGLSGARLAWGGEANLSHYGKLTLPQAQGYREQLRKLPPLPDFVDKIDRSERLLAADVICGIARGEFALGDIALLSGGPVESDNKARKALNEIAAWLAFDGDVMLRTVNAHYDRLVAAGRLPNFAERKKALEELEEQLRQQREQRTGPLGIASRLLKHGSPRRVASETLGDLLIGLLAPAAKACVEAQQQAEALAVLSDVMLALGAYRTDHGHYPDSLAALQPKYLDKLPDDPYSGGRVQYRREKDGYALYAVGANLKDDGGYGRWPLGQKDFEYDDVGFRVPLPPQEH